MIAILSGLLTPLIAVVATFIAYQQWQTNRQKLILDRYDRRLRVYEEVKKYLSIVIRDADVTYEASIKFVTSVSEADFLFGAEIPRYIDDLYKRGVDLHHWKSEYRDSTQPIPPGYDHKKVVDNMHAQLNWFVVQLEPAKQKFKKYLDVSR